MSQKITTLTSLYFIIQLCFVVGFPTPGNPNEGTKDPSETKPEEVKPATEEAAKAAAKATEAVGKEASKLSQTPSGVGKPGLTQEEAEALLLDMLEPILFPPVPITRPSHPTPDKEKQVNQLVNLLAAGSQNPEVLANILKSVPNPAVFIRSLFAWIGPSSQIIQNTINGLVEIHMKNRQPGVELMRAMTEPLAILLRGFLAPTGLSPQVDIFRSATMKGISSNVDDAVQRTKVMADTIPQGMQRFQTQANGLIDMPMLNY